MPSKLLKGSEARKALECVLEMTQRDTRGVDREELVRRLIAINQQCRIGIERGKEQEGKIVGILEGAVENGKKTVDHLNRMVEVVGTLTNLATLSARLARELKRVDPGNPLYPKTLDFLRRHKLINILRQAEQESDEHTRNNEEQIG